MTRESTSDQLIALLATGDEVINGDILNSNAQEIARRLFDQGMQIGMHMAVADKIADIEVAITFLLKHHRAVIITGGLGPTSDDLTRYALAKAVQQELIFDEPTWMSIEERLKRFGYSTPPTTNRQQALFPANSTIIPNPNGTAAGCMLTYQNQWLFMLPGPPNECLPMMDTTVIPTLTQHEFQSIRYHKKWLLLGVSEGHIAEILDAIAKPFACMTGYRLAYPYLEFKIYSNHVDDFNALTPLIENAIRPYIIEQGQLTAAQALIQLVQKQASNINITDSATGGVLESLLRIPETDMHFHFCDALASFSNTLQIKIEGLKEYWLEEFNKTKATIEITFTEGESALTEKLDIPFRGKRVRAYAAEFICWKMYEFLTAAKIAR